MNDLMQVIWSYAMEFRMNECYGTESWREKRECEEALERGLEKLKAVCGPEVFNRIGALCDNYDELDNKNMEAAFVCGFRLGMELR